MKSQKILEVDKKTLCLKGSEEDLFVIDSTSLRFCAIPILGKERAIPHVVKRTLQCPGRAVGIAITEYSPVYWQIAKVAVRLACGEVDWEEIQPRSSGGIRAVTNAARKVFEAIECGIPLICVPPYLFPDQRGNGNGWDVSKQFRVMTEVPIDGDKEEVCMPAIVPILDDWFHASDDYSETEKFQVVDAMAKDPTFGLDFAIVLGTVMGIKRELLDQLDPNAEYIEGIASRVYGITKGKEISKTTEYLEIAKIIEKNNRMSIAFSFVKYSNTYLYCIDFGSVLFQKIEKSEVYLNDDALLAIHEQYGELMTFCPLDAFRVRRARTKQKENIFYDKDPIAVLGRMAEFVNHYYIDGHIAPREEEDKKTPV